MAMSRDLSVKSYTTVSGVVTVATGAQVINGDINLVTCTAAGDAVVLPANLPVGTVVYITALTAAGIVFPPTGGAINGGTATTGSVVVAQDVTHIVLCTKDGSASTYRIHKLAAL